MGVALALGGGGVRGFAHLGVLEVLSKEGIPLLALSGSSAGAVAAAAFAFGLKDPGRILEAVFDPEAAALSSQGRLQSFYRILSGFRRPSLLSGERARAGLFQLFGEARLEESPIPLRIQAADLFTGEAVVLKEGRVAEAVLASSAIPGVFPPVLLNGRLLVDGDVAEKVPVRAVRPFGRVVAVDVSNPPVTAPPKTALEAALLAGEASRRRLKELALKEADLVLRLDPPYPIDTFDHTQVEFVYELGKARALEALPEIRRLARPPYTPFCCILRALRRAVSKNLKDRYNGP
ncbi:patatin-like phospholipase family protein [Thermus filiformis]|uniref:patatin-like phospholipase family protein n=1 Tax=Thermus filiformis TaxID=276 RepID=UPI001F0026F6|nr:patatin-like phospholipase family protein [Thermus filiformis]